jgi:hypothetical protein
MDPWPLHTISRLEGPDFVVALQGRQDFVEAFEQAGAAARIDLEMMLFSGRRQDGLRFEIDADTP